MRIIFLNSWYGKVGSKLHKFIKDQSLEADIFCFTEVDPIWFFKLESLLPDFKGVYTTENKVELSSHLYGQAVFLKKGFSIKDSSKLDVYRNVINDVGFVEYYSLKFGSKTIHLGNIHGKARPGHKLDTPARLRQSQKIIKLFKDKKGPKIIGGDFNLYPDTKSVRMFEEVGYRNLIRDFGVKNTRNKLSWKQFDNVQYFADYCFVSSEVTVKNFEVPYNEISDHLPLILDFEV